MNGATPELKRERVASHYTLGNIMDRIRAGLAATGTVNPTIDTLSAVDEFHIGGKIATEQFLPQLEISGEDRVLDVGCGIGGTARLIADRTGAIVEGIDLTEEYVLTGEALNNMVGAGTNVRLSVGDATRIEAEDASFDRAYTMHVCMNIDNKKQVFDEVFRVLKPGGVFGVYDVTRYGTGECQYPLPWAASSETSFLASSDEYVELLKSAGFDVERVTDRYQFAVEFFEAVKAKLSSGDGPPPLGIHVLMGDDAKIKVQNLTANLQNGLVAPFEFIVRKPLK